MIGVVLTAVALLVAWAFIKFRRLEAKVAHIPGPPTKPIIGSGLLFIGKTLEEVLKTMKKLHTDYGKIFKVHLGYETVIVMSDPKDVEVLLSSQIMIEKSDEYDAIADWLGTGLLISTGQKWFIRRKVLTPAFHFQILDQFIETFDKNSAIFVNNLGKFKDQVFDVFPLVALCALDVICETSMGVEINAQTNSDSEYVNAVKDLTQILVQRQIHFLLRNKWIFKLTPAYWKQKKHLEVLHGFTDSVILARRDELMKSLAMPADEVKDEVGSKRKMALLDVLLRSRVNGRPLSNMDIREEVDTFMFEGHDTTTSGIAFSLYNLAKYPKIQQKAFSEIRNVIGDDTTTPVELNDLNNLNYLELVIKETLRLFPSVPFYGRKIRKSFDLNGKRIPKGATLGVAAYFMGQDPNIFKDPDSFIPERFLVDNSCHNAFAYLPFSAGPRNCIGQKFAMLEMKSTISKVLRNFELTLAEGFEPTLIYAIILKPSNGILVKLKPRIYDSPF